MIDSDLGGKQYRITYRREGWESAQMRYYTRLADVMRFLSKLRGEGDEHWDLAPLDLLRVDERPVGVWVESSAGR